MDVQNGVRPGIPDVKVVINWKSTLRMILILEGDDRLDVFRSDRVEVFPEFMQKLQATQDSNVISVLLTSLTLAALFTILTSVE